MLFYIKKVNALAAESSTSPSLILASIWSLLLFVSAAWASDTTSKNNKALDVDTVTKATKASKDFSLPLFLDKLHKQAGTQYVSSVQWLDEHFKNSNDPEEHNHSTIRVQSGYGWASDDQKWDPNFRLRSHLDLPKLNRKLKLILDSASEDVLDSIMEGAENSFNFIQRRQGGPQGLGLGLRYLISKSTRQHLNLDLGVRARFPVQVFLRGDYRRNIPLWQEWTFSFRQHLFGIINGVSGTSTELNLRKPINKKLSYRLSQILRYSETSQGVEFDHTHSFFRWIQKTEAISLYFGFSGDSDAKWKATRFGYGLQYRRPFFRPWIRGILDPGIHHLREDNWKEVYSILIGAEVLLGNPKTAPTLSSTPHTIQP
jgi:hypothetical protein